MKPLLALMIMLYLGSVPAFAGEEIRPQSEKASEYNYQGIELTVKEDFDGALAAFEKAMQEDPGNAEFDYNTGVVYVRKGDLESARLSFESAVGKNPRHHTSLLALGLYYAKTGNHERAIEWYQKAVAAQPAYASAYYNRGIAQVKLKDYEAAVESLTTAMEKGENSADIHYQLGIAYGEQGNKSKVALMLYRLQEMDRNDLGVFLSPYLTGKEGSVRVTMKPIGSEPEGKQ